MNTTNPLTSLTSLAALAALGYEGPDASLEESLFEYGVAWSRAHVPGKVRFVYKTNTTNTTNEAGDQCQDGAPRFSWAEYREDVDAREEFNWVDWKQVASVTGRLITDILSDSFEQICFILMIYYGQENVFGSDYSEGFPISP